MHPRLPPNRSTGDRAHRPGVAVIDVLLVAASRVTQWSIVLALSFSNFPPALLANDISPDEVRKELVQRLSPVRSFELSLTVQQFPDGVPAPFQDLGFITSPLHFHRIWSDVHGERCDIEQPERPERGTVSLEYDGNLARELTRLPDGTLTKVIVRPGRIAGDQFQDFTDWCTGLRIPYTERSLIELCAVPQFRVLDGAAESSVVTLSIPACPTSTGSVDVRIEVCPDRAWSLHRIEVARGSSDVERRRTTLIEIAEHQRIRAEDGSGELMLPRVATMTSWRGGRTSEKLIARLDFHSIRINRRIASSEFVTAIPAGTRVEEHDIPGRPPQVSIAGGDAGMAVLLARQQETLDEAIRLREEQLAKTGIVTVARRQRFRVGDSLLIAAFLCLLAATVTWWYGRRRRSAARD